MRLQRSTACAYPAPKTHTIYPYVFDAVARYRVLAGDFDFMEMYRNNRVIGPAFLLMWTMIGLTVLFNVFVAILMESYEITKTQDVGFVDMLQENLMRPFAAKFDQLMKKLGIDAGYIADDAPLQEDAASVPEPQQEVAVSRASFGRLMRPKKVVKNTEVREIILHCVQLMNEGVVEYVSCNRSSAYRANRKLQSKATLRRPA